MTCWKTLHDFSLPDLIGALQFCNVKDLTEQLAPSVSCHAPQSLQGLPEFPLAIVAWSFTGVVVIDDLALNSMQVYNRWLDPLVLAVLFISEDQPGFLDDRILRCGNRCKESWFALNLRSDNDGIPVTFGGGEQRW